MAPVRAEAAYTPAPAAEAMAAGAENSKEALINSARADSERFCFLRKFGKSRNTVCISDFPNCTEGAKDPLLSRRRFIQRFPKESMARSFDRASGCGMKTHTSKGCMITGQRRDRRVIPLACSKFRIVCP